VVRDDELIIPRGKRPADGRRSDLFHQRGRQTLDTLAVFDKHAEPLNGG
jgi:hypothetical protein